MSDGFCGIVRRCNALLFSGGLSRSTYFVVNGRRVGLVREDILEHLKKHPEVFTLKPPTGPNEKPQLHLSDSLKTPEERTMAVEGLLKKLRTEDQFICLRGWRNERYDAKVRFSEPPLFAVERAAACLFGLNQYGTHCNVYTKDEDGKLLMWIARRSPTKPTFPGKLDNLCAGGLASGLSVRECMVKECQEEAAVPLHYTDRLIACGTVSYLYEDERGIHPETQFVYDLEVPSDFKPVNTDGEVAEFRLVSLEEVKQLIVTTEFKPNCALVILDFLVRHGFVTPENEPNYPYLVELMHYPLQRLFDQN